MPPDVEHGQEESARLMEGRYNDGSGSETQCSSPTLRTSSFDEKSSEYTENTASTLIRRLNAARQSWPVWANNLASFCTRLFYLLLPSFLHRFLRKKTDAEPLHPTAYLDGLRGVAAFIVVIFHFSLDWYPSMARGYYEEDPKRYWLQLPWIRTVYSGRGMVAIFFVISGYVLSAKALRLMRAEASEKLLASLSSSMFRRAIRLFLPCVFSTIPAFILTRYGLMLHDVMGANLIPPTANNLRDQFWHYVDAMSRMVNVFNTPSVGNMYGMVYDGHLWTIPIEFRGSVVVFCVLLAITQVRPWLRPVILFSTAMYNLHETHWDLFLFLSGTFLAELQSIVTARPEALDHSDLKPITRLTKYVASARKIIGHPIVKNSIIGITVMLGTLMLGTPDLSAGDIPNAPLGYSTLLKLTPKPYLHPNDVHPAGSPTQVGGQGVQKFWLAVGAVIIITAMSFSKPLQYPFTSRFAQYLGFISYSLYLMHGIVLYTWPMAILRAAITRGMGSTNWEGKGKGVPFEGVGEGYGLEFVKASTIALVGCIYASDVFTRLVDVPCVDFANWIYRKCSR